MKIRSIKYCINCNNSFIPINSTQERSRKFCSLTCAYEYRKIDPNYIPPALGKYQSSAAREKNRLSSLGKNGPGYIDGRSKDRGWRYRDWVIKVKKRDNYTCQCCKIKVYGRNCIAHHIKNWNSHPHLQTELDNGITLCRPCHNRIHRAIEFIHKYNNSIFLISEGL